MLLKASSRMYILRICKHYGYSSLELNQLFNSLIMPIFLYGIEVWGGAHQTKYINRIDSFLKRAHKFGFITESNSFQDVIRKRDRHLWDNIIANENHCLYDMLPNRRNRSLRNRGHDFILPRVKTDRFKRCFLNRCLYNFL